MKHIYSKLALAVLFFFSLNLDAQTTTYLWNGSSATTVTSGSNVNITSTGTWAQGNNYGTTTMLSNSSVSSGYSGASGSFNFASACASGVLNTATSTYYTVTITPASGYKISVTGISFGSRSTGTGPTNLAVRTDADAYASDIASSVISTNSTWTLLNPTVSGSAANGSLNTALTLRIYGYGGGSASMNTANWRIDDINLTVVVTSNTNPTKLAITGITPSTPTQNSTFNVTVQSQDGNSLPANVTTNTGISLAANNGFTLSGTTTGTMNSGSNSITFNNVSLTAAGSGASITASTTSGDVLTDGTTATFNVLAAQPTNQPTSFAGNGASTSGITIGWTAATGSPDGYLLLRTTSSGSTYPNTDPADGTTYSIGATIGNATVEYAGSSVSALISSLSAQSLYSYKIYSYNGSGNTINYLTTSPLQGQAYTLSSEPSTHAASFTNTVNSTTSVTLNFSASSTVSASGYIIIKKTSSFTGADYPSDGSAYIAGNTIGGATVVTTIATTSTTSANNTVVADGNFNYLLIPFNWDGTNAGTRNYYTGGSIPLTTATTPSGASDFTAVSSSESATVSSIINTSGITTNADGTQVWQFTVRDGGSGMNDGDALPTIIKAITFTQSGGNQIDNFSNSIQSIALFNGSTLISSGVNTTITSTQIQFANLNLSVADNSFITLSLRLSVKSNVNAGASTGVNADGDDFGFQISVGNVTTDVVANSSQLSNFSAISSANAQNVYTVDATKLLFVQEPTNVSTYTNISPAVTVQATDAGGNRDLGFVSAVGLTANGATLTTTPSSNAASGLASFSSLQLSTAGTGVTFNATSTGLTGAISTSFDVTLGSASYAYRTVRSGAWKEVATGVEVWERSTDGTNWITVTDQGDVPSEVNGAINIRNGHTITIGASCTADDLTIETGGQITIPSGNTFTINNGTATDFTINGTLNNEGTLTVNSGATLAFGENSLYQHNVTSGIPTASWHLSSTCEIKGVTTTVPGGLTQSFGNFTWNCASQSSSINLAANLNTVNGNLTVSNTGSAELRLTATNSLTLNIGGNFNVGDDISLDENATGTTVINISGNFNHTAGVFKSGSDDVTLNMLGTDKTFLCTNIDATNDNLNWVIASSASVTLLSNLPVASSRSLIVNGILNCGTYNVRGNGDFTLAATGTLGIGDIDGITTGTTNGNIRVSGTRLLNAAATYKYNGVSIQVTGDALTETGMIMIDNASGVNLSQLTTLTGSLNLVNGEFNAANNLTFATTGSLLFNGGTIINYTFPATLNNFTPTPGSSTLPSNLTINGTLDLGNTIFDISNKTLIIAGDVTRDTGTIRTSGGNITINGATADQGLYFDQTTPGTTNVLATLTIDRASSIITLNNGLCVSGTVTPTSGTLASSGNLTLLSSVSGSAKIAQIQSGADITGDVNVQRYIVGGISTQRGWRSMSSPVQSFTYAQLSDDLLISGTGGTANGFDASGSNSSIRYFEESNNRGWKSITSTNNTLDAGRGMLVFFRGDKSQTTSLTDNTVVPNNLTADFTGTINKNTINVSLDYFNSGIAADDGFNFVGNPYPCEIDWNNVTKTAGVDVNFWVLNPITGNYVSQTGNIDIASGQGFFVQVNQASQSITFEESHKSSGNATAYFKTASAPFTIKMFTDSIRYDIAWLDFSSTASANYVFKEDARKFLNTNYNLSFVTNDNQLVQRNVTHNLSLVSDTFQLQVSSLTSGPYRLTFEQLGSIPSAKNIYLVDKYLNTISDVRVINDYVFQTNTAIAASYGNRFQLIIINAGSLPVSFISFIGKKENSGNNFTLKVAGQKNIDYYELERSSDNAGFTAISSFRAIGTATTYQVKDNNPPKSVSYYRIKAVGFDGAKLYTETVIIDNVTEINLNAFVYPNPAQNRIQIKGFNANTIRIYNFAGDLILESNKNSVDISLLEGGIYLLEAQGENGTKIMKFVKN